MGFIFAMTLNPLHSSSSCFAGTLGFLRSKTTILSLLLIEIRKGESVLVIVDNFSDLSENKQLLSSVPHNADSIVLI